MTEPTRKDDDRLRGEVRMMTYALTRALVLADPRYPHNRAALDKLVLSLDARTLNRLDEATLALRQALDNALGAHGRETDDA